MMFKTGIGWFDEIFGGIPKGAVIVIAGNPGSGKTILSTQLSLALSKELPVLYASFHETRGEYVANMSRLGLNVEGAEREGRFTFLDLILVGKDVEGVLDLISSSLEKRGPSVLVVDSVTALASMLNNASRYRMFLHNIAYRITKVLGGVTILIVEVPYGSRRIGTGIEEFVSDAVFLLRKRAWPTTYTMEVLKARWCGLYRERYEYIIDPKYGGVEAIVIPRQLVGVERPMKVKTGVELLDEMLGGVHRGTMTLIVGDAGIGKTLLALSLACASRGNALFLSFEEPESQLRYKIERFGLKCNNVRVQTLLPEAITPLAYYKLIREGVVESNASVLVIDGVNALTHVMSKDAFIEFNRYLQVITKERGLLTFITVRRISEEYMIGLTTVADNMLEMTYRGYKRVLSVAKLRLDKPRVDEIRFRIGAGGLEPDYP